MRIVMRRLLKLQNLRFAGLAIMRMGISFSQLLIVLVAGRILDAQSFGRFAIVFAGARLLAALSGLGAPSYLLKDVPWRQAKGMPWHATGSAMATFGLYPALICAAAGLAAEGLARMGLAAYPLLPGEGAAGALLAFVWSVMLTLAAYIRATRTATLAMLVGDVATPLAILGALVGSYAMGGLAIAGVILVSSALVALMIGGLLAWHAVARWIPVGGTGGEPVRLGELVQYWGTVMLNTASTQIDILIAGATVGPAATGVYTIVKRMTNILALPASIVVWILAPQVSRASASGDDAALARAARSAIRLSFVPAVGLALLVGASAPWWLDYFGLSPDPELWLVLALLLAANLLSVAFGPSILFATQTGIPGAAVRALSWALAVSAPLMAVGGLVLGAAAIAIGQIVMFTLINVLIARRVYRHRGLRYSLFAALSRN